MKKFHNFFTTNFQLIKSGVFNQNSLERFTGYHLGIGFVRVQSEVRTVFMEIQ